MPTTLDLLRSPEFADRRLTETINIPPYVTGRPAQLGIFSDTPIASTYVRLLIENGEITIIPARERGGPANKNMRNDRSETLVSVPHFPLDDAITPSDIQNLIVFGEEMQMMSLANVVNDKLETMRSKHDATHNHLDWGALNGLIVDAEGKILCDLWDTFGITQEEVDFALDNGSTDIASKNGEVKGLVRKALRGAPSRGVHVFAGTEFFDKYVGHAFVRDSLKYYSGPTPNPARDDVADVFTFRGLTIERIDEEFQVRLANGTFEAKPAIAEDEAVAFPLGTPFFKRYVAPPDTIQDANNAPRPGEKIFVSTDTLPHGKGEDVHTESNVLPICTRPELMIKLTM
jgi:hypothetical protein